MAKKPGTSEIRREADAHIELGMLLRRSREPAHRQAVEDLLRTNRPIEDIIREIKKLDRLARAERPARATSADEKSGEREGTVADGEEPAGERGETGEPAGETEERTGGGEKPIRHQPLRHSMAVVSSVIKMPFKPNAYFVFLFRELGQVREFGRKSHVLLPVFFPPNVRLNELVRRTFQRELVTSASELRELTAQALELGWYYLGKRSYNLLVVLKRLCDRLMETNFGALDLKDRNLIDRLRALESIFYVLHYRETYPELVVSSLQQVLERDPRYAGEREEIAELVRRILLPDAMLPSLYEFLVGLNMLKHRRFFALGDLICRDLGDIVNTREFGCSASVRKRIEEFIQESREKLVQLLEQRKETERLRIYLPEAKGDKLDFSSLGEFYEGSAIANAHYDFNADQQNVMVFAPRFFRAFENILFPLFGGNVALTGGARSRIFEKSFFPTEFPKLRQIGTKLDKLAFNYRSFPKTRFLQIKDGAKAAIPVELEIINLIDDAVSIMTAMGRKLEKLIRAQEGEGGAGGRAEPSGRSAAARRAYRIPHREEGVRSHTVLNGKSVQEAVIFATSICFTAAGYFQNL